MDFSENSQMHKYEPQSSHFNKSHYSLHCTVKHDIHEEEPMYTYIYHLSDVSIITMHSLQLLFIISSAYSHRLILYDLSLTIAQYNINPNMFYFWQSLAKYLGKKCLVYQGVCRHGEGLADPMIAFAVKNILRKAVLTENFSYNKASGIYDYLIKHFEQDPQKKYFFLESETIYVKQPQKKTCYIKNFQKLPHDLFPP